MTAPTTLSQRALNRATLARQLLLERSSMPVLDAVEHLLGLQAQTPQTWYLGLWSRLADFDPEELSALLGDRRVVRMALMRSTIHLVSAADARAMRPLVQVVQDRALQGNYGRRLAGLDLEEVDAAGRAIVDERPATFKELGDRLHERWPDRDPHALSMRIRTSVPLVQVPPRGLWRRSGAVRHTSLEAWLGQATGDATRLTLDDLVWRYLAAFGPASVADVQTWCGLTRLREVVERLRPTLVTFRDDRGRELYDVPDGPRPDPETPAPPRFLYEFDNLLLSHDDRTRVVTPEQQAGLERTAQGLVNSFLLDGVVAGSWRLEREPGRASSATLVICGLAPIPAEDAEALEGEGRALLDVLAPDADARTVRFEAGTAC